MKIFDSHIARFNAPQKARLRQLAKAIDALIPGAEHTISYGIPTFKLNGKNCVHFAGFKNHVSLFPTAAPIAHFAAKLKSYKISRGTIQFPHDKDLPLKLISEIVKWRVKEMSSLPPPAKRGRLARAA